MIKLSLGWIVAGVAAAGVAAYAAFSGGSKSSGPKALVKVPFNPGEDDCDIAYGMLPDDVQEIYNNAVIAANVDSAKLAKLKGLVQEIGTHPDIDDVAKRTFQKCFWKKAAQSGQATIAEAIAAVPSLASVLSGNALGQGSSSSMSDDPVGGTMGDAPDDEIDTLMFQPPTAPIGTLMFQPPIAPIGTLAFQPPAPTQARITWPALRRLPEPYRSKALQLVGASSDGKTDDLNYYAAIGERGMTVTYEYDGLYGMASGADGDGGYSMPQHSCNMGCKDLHSGWVALYGDELEGLNAAKFGPGKQGIAIRDDAIQELKAAWQLLVSNGW